MHEKNNNKGLLCLETVEQCVDCYPERGENKTEDEAKDTCHNHGWCWVDGGPDGVSFCFFQDGCMWLHYGYCAKHYSNGMTVKMYKNDHTLEK